MQNLLEDLKELLQKDERLTADGELLKNKIVELALKLDADLIKLLLSHDKLKEHFFTHVGEATIFDKDKFIKFVSNKQFLPDSYTAFKNKIGLTEDDEYISEKKDVVLSWPYKDCVLEGGQTKEDAKRDEIFWNQTLAPDEIDRLLDPKVFTNAKRVDKDGGHDFGKFNRREDGTISDNLIIKGNNLLALHSLKKEFAGKVKLIYIDPPYNTGNDSFGYNDNFNHSTWLTFMSNRIQIAKELLKENGVIFVHCDDNEQAYLSVFMDEIFKENNFIGNIITLTNRSGRDYGGIARTHDYILVYGKSDKTEIYGIENPNKKFPYEDKYGRFQLRGLRNRNVRFNVKNRPNLFYPIYVNPSNEDENGLHEIGLEEKEGWIEIFPQKSQGIQTVWRWGKEKVKQEGYKNLCARKSRTRKFRIMEKYRDAKSMVRSVWYEKDIRNEKATLHLKKLFGKKLFDYPKAEEILKKVIEMGTRENDIVLDFFAGSGTTGAVAHKMGRQYILCEQLGNHAEVIKKRMQKVIKGEQGGISEEINWQGGGNYVYLELAEWNEEFVKKVQKAKTNKELRKIWEEMQKSAFLSWRLDFGKLEKNAKEFDDLSLENQKEFLLEVLDQNQLYVNYSEIEDKMYGISEGDKKLNKEFYGK
jgi:adenine-specific DNA-methyltransferase